MNIIKFNISLKTKKLTQKTRLLERNEFPPQRRSLIQNTELRIYSLIFSIGGVTIQI